jgi:hypothetical protein
MDDPVGYLYRTAMNLFRKRYRRVLLAFRRTLGLPPARDDFADADDRHALRRVLSTLPPRRRIGHDRERGRSPLSGAVSVRSQSDSCFQSFGLDRVRVRYVSRRSAALCPLSGTTVPNGTSPTSMGSGSHGSVKAPAWLPSCATTRPQARRSGSGTDPCTADGMCDSSPSADGSSAQDGARRGASGSRPGTPGVSGARAGTASRRSKGANQLSRSEASTSSIGRRQRSDPSAGLRVSS